MKYLSSILFLFLIASPLPAKTGLGSCGNTVCPALYLTPNAGFENSIAGGLTKKHAKVQIVTDQSKADYILSSTGVWNHQDTVVRNTGKVMIFGGRGWETADASVVLIDARSKNIVWAYNVAKYWAAHNRQSMSEAVAKHLKNEFLRITSASLAPLAPVTNPSPAAPLPQSVVAPPLVAPLPQPVGGFTPSPYDTEIAALFNAGFSQDVIVAKTSVSPDRTELGVKDLMWLKDQGVTGKVLTSVLSGVAPVTKSSSNGWTLDTGSGPSGQ